MSLKVLISLILLGVGVVAVNHFVLDWDVLSAGKVHDHFDELISDQNADLERWISDGNGDANFSKRSFCKGELTKWSDDRFWGDVETSKELEVIESESGILLVQRIAVTDSCFAESMYYLSYNYSITNKYLKSRNNISLPKDLVSISSSAGDIDYKGLFYYSIKGSASKGTDAAAGAVVLLAMLVLFWKGLSNRFLITVAIVFILRIVTLYFGLLKGFFGYALFDSLYYTSSIWNPTLGDLLLNVLLIFLTTLNWSRRFRHHSEVKSNLEIITYSLFGLALSASVFSIIWSILDNSQISMDVGKTIEFGLLRVIGYISVGLMVGSQFLFSFRTVGQISKMNQPNLVYVVLLCASLSLFFFSSSVALVGIIFAGIVVVTSKFKWGNKLKDFKYENLQFVLLVSVYLAGVLSFSVYKFHEKSELDAKRKFANHLLIKRDVLGEYYLNQLLIDLNDLDSQAKSNERIVEEINLELLNTYFDKYDIKLLAPTTDSVAYFSTLKELNSEKLSDYDNIYFLDEGTEFRYICKVDELLLSLELRKRVPTSVFPALLTDSKYFTPSDDFDYAVFKNGEILFQRSKFGQGEWPENADFENPRLYKHGIEKNGRHYYGVATVDGRVILIISKKYNRRMQLTNFSFFFLLNLFFLGGIVLLSSLDLKQARLNFTGKIQLYLGLAFIIPLFTAGFALLNSLNTSYKEEINRSYLKRSLYISELLSSNLKVGVEEISSERLAEVRDIIQADVSLYNNEGWLLATSQKEVFDLGLESNLINPIVFEELIAKENQSMIAEASIGGLDYKVSFATVNDYSDHVVGFIAMPFFDSKNHLKRQQLEVFGSLTSIFGFIFIITILFGNLILNNLMKPLRMVADKIKQITLQEENKPILYESSDEIGSLVRDYNLMLVKLEQSKRALARSQKETAWKEIARQVAHEIKNPLTPMRLKIQQLMRKYESGSKDFEILSGLLIQVDTLSQIAGSFSAFAEMPAPDNSDFDFSQLVKRVVGLFPSESVAISTEIEESVYIHADKDIFQRILNNIVLNAIQSAESKNSLIDIKLKTKPGKCELSVRDNGKGIPDELKDKIFLNYFSTKSSGSGIGLALAKKGIENAGGNIWFESKENEGTTFYISMPLADS